MVEVNPNGELVSTSDLDLERHPQAEGIVIATDGTFFISDEGKRRGTITIYSSKK